MLSGVVLIREVAENNMHLPAQSVEIKIWSKLPMQDCAHILDQLRYCQSSYNHKRYTMPRIWLKSDQVCTIFLTYRIYKDGCLLGSLRKSPSWTMVSRRGFWHYFFTDHHLVRTNCYIFYCQTLLMSSPLCGKRNLVLCELWNHC